MKYKILSLIIISLLLINTSCKKESNAIVEGPEDSIPNNGGQLELDKISGLDVTSLTIQTFEDSAKVNEDGSFDVKSENTAEEELPLIFIKDNELIFGYFHASDTDNVVSEDDMLLFYFSMHPEIILHNLPKSELLNRIKSHANYEDLKEEMSNALNKNASPLHNELFVELLNSTGYSIIKLMSKQKLKSAKVDIFRYLYSRDGSITWPNKFPIFATVGLEIINTSSQKVVSGPHLLDKSGLVASPGSVLEWMYDYANLKIEDTRTTFKLPAEGQYEVRFSNGVDGLWSDELEDKVDIINTFNLSVDLLNFLLPFGIKKFIGEVECRDALIDVMKHLKFAPAKAAVGNKLALDKELKKLGSNIYKAAKACVPGGKEKYTGLVSTATKYFNIAEEGASIMLLFRDYVVSDIYESELRHYYKGVSYGPLELTNLSGFEYIKSTGITEFSGAKESQHEFKAKIEEKIYNYHIESDFKIKSTVEKKPMQELAIGIPFSITKASGDAKVLYDTKTVKTSISGTLSSVFIMGNENSEFNINPMFSNTILNPEKVILNVAVSDSTEIFLEAIPGYWTSTWYYDHDKDNVWEKSQVDKVVLYADGTGHRVSSISSNGVESDYTDKWGTDPFYQIVWSLSGNNKVGYHLSYHDKRWSTVKKGGRLLAYPDLHGMVTMFGDTRVISIKD